MYRYTNTEMTDMLLAYGKADGNGRAAARLYAERFPNRNTPHHGTFAAIERRVRESGKLQVSTIEPCKVCYICAYSSMVLNTVSILLHFRSVLGV